ncbi:MULTISPECIES: MarR family winged helix-turn-helix transcriptional regulator [unclassified Microbacterium]|uniref:MarR family winged helix-turn-helix transcriptional regulator n=1 Tax=unclassified Microbacterium TaxID=2609290 RepID=UPI0011AEF6C2|nr:MULTISPECIES: hypothetical protein [unclassified Microbacterium]
MNDTQNTPNGASDDARPTAPLPLGYWLRAVDAMITREFANALAAEDVDRRDWMLLNAVSGDVDVPGWLASRVQGRGGKRLRALAERGWIARTEDSWTLTDEGRAAKARLAGIVDGIRERVSSAVTADDYATMTASLEAIARELGWDESERMPRHGRGGFGPGRGFGPDRGFGPAFGPSFGRAFGPGVGPAFGPDFDPRAGHHGERERCGPREHRRGDHRGERHAERAFERGFDAGFRAARERAEAS